MSLHPNDVVFSRHTFALAQSASDVSITHPEQEFWNDSMSGPGQAGSGSAIGQRHNVQLSVFFTGNAASAALVGAGGTTRLNSTATASGRVHVVTAAVSDQNQGDSAPGFSGLTGCGVNGSLALSTMWTNIDETDPIGADGIIQKVGSSATLAADALVVTERARIIRIWLTLDNDATLGTPTPDLNALTASTAPGYDPDNGELRVAGANTTGTDYAYIMEDLGTYDVGETVLAQTATSSTSRVWTVLTIPLKLRDVGDMAPQIVVYDNNSASTGSVSLVVSGGVFGSAGRTRVGDHVFVLAQSNSGEPSNSAGGYTKISTPGGSNTSIFHLELPTSAIPSPSTFGGGGSSNSVCYMIVRGLDPTTPYTIADDNETEATMDVPSATIVRARDIDISIFQQGASGITSNFTFTPSTARETAMFGASANSNNRSRGQAYAEMGSLTPGSSAGITATSNFPGTVYRGAHLILHQAPKIVFVEASLTFDFDVDAAVQTFGGATFVEAENLTFDFTLEATVRSFRSRRRAPRREYVWVTDLHGDQIGVIR